MAGYDAIRVLGEGLMKLMRERCPRAELELASDAVFEVASLKAFAGESTLNEGFYLCLWRVGIGGSPRQLSSRRTPEGLRRPSLPLDLHFLLTPVASDAPKHARMLGWSMRFMHDTAVLSADTINAYAQVPAAVFNAGETVEFIADPLALPDYLSLWDRVKHVFPGGMTYLARMVLLDSEVFEPDAALVREREFRLRREGASG